MIFEGQSLVEGEFCKEQGSLEPLTCLVWLVGNAGSGIEYFRDRGRSLRDSGSVEGFLSLIPASDIFGMACNMVACRARTWTMICPENETDKNIV